MALLEFRGVKKRFGNKEILSGVSFDIYEGEIFGLVGISGGGKTTLLNILIGISKANNGQILFQGRDILRSSKNLRRIIGLASQRNMLFDELTLKENSLYFGKLYGMGRKKILERFNYLKDLLGLIGLEKLQIKNFSGGMIKRANLLVSLIHDPKILILDEPTVGLDPLLRNVLWKYIKEINKNGATILVISHLLEEIEENCRRIGILKNGKLVAVGSTDQYKQAYPNKSFSEIFESILKNENL